MRKQYLFFLIVSLLLASCSLDKKVERKNKKSYAKAPYDAVVIPGYPYEAEQNRELFTIRLNWAKTVYERGMAKNIIFSGSAVHTPYQEGKIMKIYAEAMGIPAEHIFEENEALSTVQNIKNCKKLAKELGFKKIAFATDPFQFAYMTILVNLKAPGTPLITFSTDSMAFYNQPLPKVDVHPAYIENWTPPAR